MLHLIFCLRRLPHLTREEFQRYWREHHAAVLGMRRYVQAHTTTPGMAQAITAVRAAPDPYDGVAELWFDEQVVMSRSAMPEALEAGRALLEDERRFIDLAHSPIFFAQEHVVIDSACA